MREIGFVAIGKAGSTIGQMLFQRGYKVCFIDSNNTDIQHLNIGFHLKKHIPSSYGTGGDREKSKQYTEMYYDDLLEFIESALPNKKLYLFITSQGGGTGSGMTPILSHILGLKHPVGIISIMPSNTESIDILKNSLMFLEEVADKDHPCKSHFIYDNATGGKSRVNEFIVSDIDALLSIPNEYSIIESIDKADILSVLSQHSGYSIIIKFNSDKEHFRDTLYHSLRNGIFPSIQFDKCIESMMISYGFPEDYGFTDDLVREFSNYNIRRTENFIDRDSNHIVLMVGLRYPINRIEQIKSTIQSYEELDRDAYVKYDFNIGSTTTQKEEKVDLNSVFSKYKK